MLDGDARVTGDADISSDELFARGDGLGGVAAQEAFSVSQLADLEATLHRADQGSRFTFTIFVGGLPHGRSSAVSLHRHLRDPDRTVLVAVDPQDRGLEIVTGAATQEGLDERACRLACMAMTSRFTIGDIASGLRDGVTVLAEHSRRPRVLHGDLPENA